MYACLLDFNLNPFFPLNGNPHPTIDYYFDAAIHVVRRSKELAWESKELVVALPILILLIQHSFHVLMKSVHLANFGLLVIASRHSPVERWSCLVSNITKRNDILAEARVGTIQGVAGELVRYGVPIVTAAAGFVVAWAKGLHFPWSVVFGLGVSLTLAIIANFVSLIITRPKNHQVQEHRPALGEPALTRKGADLNNLQQKFDVLQAKYDDLEWLGEVAKEQAQYLGRLVHVERVIISGHRLLGSSPYIELDFTLKNFSIYRVSIDQPVGHLCYGNEELEGIPSLVGDRIRDLPFWHTAGFVLRQPLMTHEAISILNTNTSFGFQRLTIPITASPGSIDVQSLILNYSLGNNEILKSYPKLETSILVAELREYRDLTENRRFGLPAHLGSIVNINLHFENPRPKAIEIKQFKLTTFSDAVRTTVAQTGEIRERPAVGVSGEAQGLALPNLNGRPICAEQREPFEGWLQFIVKVPPESIRGSIADLTIIDGSGEEHVLQVPRLRYKTEGDESS